MIKEQNEVQSSVSIHSPHDSKYLSSLWLHNKCSVELHHLQMQFKTHAVKNASFRIG